jgi:hypothetical protein
MPGDLPPFDHGRISTDTDLERTAERLSGRYHERHGSLDLAKVTEAHRYEEVLHLIAEVHRLRARSGPAEAQGTPQA